MDPNDPQLDATRTALRDTAGRVAQLVRTQPDLTTLIGDGSTWTVRETAAHLVVCANVYGDLAAGMPSPAHSLAKVDLAELSDQLISDIAESDPDKLARLVLDAVDRFLQATAGRPGAQRLPFHCASTVSLAELTGIFLAEALLHGYDIAAAVGAPWPCEPAHALVVLDSYVPVLGMVVNGAAAVGHTAAYGISVRGGPSFTARFTAGAFALEAAGGPVDCEISADPMALLLVFTGRLSRWSAVTLGLLSAGGARPELALGFLDLFIYP